VAAGWTGRALAVPEVVSARQSRMDVRPVGQGSRERGE
jgi:hypothetical protein